jgi:hypothetical protein
MTHTLRSGLLAASLTLALGLTAAAGARPDVGDEVEALHREIAALRLFHALDLTAEQQAEMIPLVETGIGLADDLRAVHEVNQRDHLAVLAQVRDDLRDDGELGEATQEAVQDARKVAEKAMRPVMWEIGDLGEEVQGILDDDQRARVREALQRSPGAGPRGAGPGAGRMAPPGSDPRGEGAGDAGADGERARHRGRQLLKLVFSEEFLAVLTGLE